MVVAASAVVDLAPHPQLLVVSATTDFALSPCFIAKILFLFL